MQKLKFDLSCWWQVYPAWKWFEKQDGIRSLQKHSEDPAPEFYNIYLERPKVSLGYLYLYLIVIIPINNLPDCAFFWQGDADGYDLVVIDAMHKANYASRICHSCSPNCEAKLVFSSCILIIFILV